MKLLIGARTSDLARVQAYSVAKALKNVEENLEIEFLFKKSLGDINLEDPLWKMPEKGVFTQDLSRDLLDGKCDMVVHSWKDLPVELPVGTHLAATLARADRRDLFLIKKEAFSEIHQSRELRVLSSSPRRSHNLSPFFKAYLPFVLDDVSFFDVRGNVPTRIRKLMEAEDKHGLIVAKAALDRLLGAERSEFHEMQSELRSMLSQLEFCVLPVSCDPPAAAQGALAIEVRDGNVFLDALLKKISCEATAREASREREILSAHGGGCHQKIGVFVKQTPFGRIEMTCGQRHDGLCLDKQEFVSKRGTEALRGKKLWVSSDHTLWERVLLEIPAVPRDADLWITKNVGLDRVLQASPRLIWTAGLKTWRDLAKRGVWVHGSSESFGEGAGWENLSELLGDTPEWYKVGHSECVETSKKNIFTYELKNFELPKDILDFDLFYWASASAFFAAMQKEPSLKNKEHACGMGHTATELSKALGEKLWVFPSAAFLKECL